MPAAAGSAPLPRPAVIALVALGAWVSVTGLAQLAATIPVGRDLAVAAIGAVAVTVLGAALLALSRDRAGG
jgi:hypothetical protein